MPKFSLIILSYFFIFLLPVTAFSSEETFSEHECHSILLSRLCFKGPQKLQDLVPLAEIAKQSHKTSVKKRSGFSGQSKLSDMQKRELELKWKQIFGQVMEHARAHSLNLQNLDSMFADELGILSSPILFHEGFEWDGQSQFKITSSKVVKTNTLLEISQRLAAEGGYFSQTMSNKVKNWISQYGQGRDQIKVETLMQDFFVEALLELTLPGDRPVVKRGAILVHRNGCISRL